MKQRLYYLDTLRVIAIMMMFIFHISMIFVEQWGWHIKNSETSYMLLEFNFWMSSFRMPLLFFVSGAISFILIEKMTLQQFAWSRFKRLIIPTVIWTFILVAPQIYFERKLSGDTADYWSFYQSFLTFQWWPQGNFHWLHLWFIPYLFCYNLFSIPIVVLLKKNSTLSLQLKKLSMHNGFWFYFIAFAFLPYIALWAIYPPSFDLINDIARHVFFIFFIVAGLLFMKFAHIRSALQSNRALYFKLAFVSNIIINIIRWNGYEPEGFWQYSQMGFYGFVYLFLLSFNTWMWVLCSLGYAKEYLNKSSSFIKYANTAVYPFYILHQTVIVIIGYYVVQTSDGLLMKYISLFVICFSICWAVYHHFIKPYQLMRFMFGMNASIKITS